MPQAVADDDGDRAVGQRIVQAPRAGAVAADHERKVGARQAVRVQPQPAGVEHRAVHAPASGTFSCHPVSTMVQSLPALPQQGFQQQLHDDADRMELSRRQHIQVESAHRGRDMHASTSHAGKSKCSGSLAVLINVMLYSVSIATLAATSLRSW